METRAYDIVIQSEKPGELGIAFPLDDRPKTDREKYDRGAGAYSRRRNP